jgi:uncharacterized protein
VTSSLLNRVTVSDGLLRHGFLWRLFMLLACFQHAAVAQNSDLVIRIDVDSRTEASIDAAARQAFERALLQRSGDRTLLAHPSVSEALDTARSQLARYQFEQIESRTRFVAHIDQLALESLIRGARGTLWAEERPPILLWLVVDDNDGRRYGNLESENALWTSLSAEFETLGINLRRPLYDLSDSVLASPETLWRRDYGPIVEASERYGMTHLLLGRLIPLSSGRFIAEWTYRDASVERAVSIQADSFDALIAPGVELAMNEMLRQYAVVLSEPSTPTPIRVRVQNVVSLADYQAVTRAMSEIQTMESVRPVSVQGEMLVLDVFGISAPETLIRLMATRKDLVWIATDPDQDLILAWQN